MFLKQVSVEKTVNYTQGHTMRYLDSPLREFLKQIHWYVILIGALVCFRLNETLSKCNYLITLLTTKNF